LEFGAVLPEKVIIIISATVMVVASADLGRVTSAFPPACA
jgi:hypothetical protein